MALPIATQLDTKGGTFSSNRDDMLELIEELDRLHEEAAGGPARERGWERMRAQGKLPVRERLALLLDRDAPFIEISPLAGYHTDYPIGGTMVSGIGVVKGTECSIVASDASVMAGAMIPVSVDKWSRAMEISRANHMPYIQLVESAGGDLRGLEGEEAERSMREDLTHFASSGRQFYEVTELSKLRIPAISVVFGASTAGGAYQPGLSDYNIFVENGARVALGGPPLVKMATGEDADYEELAGARMHAETSGLADYLARDEREALRMCREVVEHLHWQKRGPGPVFPADAPLYDPEELLGIVPADLRSAFDIREVIARVVDGSRMEEFKPLYGSTMVCGWVSIHGYPVGILGNNGVIFSESAQKAAQFIQLCNQLDTPLLFLQNVTGFIVGKDFEQGGIVKHGSLLINAVSNSEVPHITVIVGASYGAGTFGMSGRAYDPRFVFTWPTARIGVMGSSQMAGVMSIVARASAARKGQAFDEAADARRAAEVERWEDLRSRAVYASGRVVDDGIIDPRDTRHVVGMALSACHSNDVRGTPGYGVFRM
jgi:acetyl-CoA carboxylase carboxyltransferase component